MVVFVQGLKITIFCITIVFLVLIILMCVIKFQNKIFSKINKRNSKKYDIFKSTDVIQKSEKLENKKLLVAIILAIGMYIGEDIKGITIKSIKKV